VPRALILGTIALTTIYVAVNLAYLQALTVDEIAAAETRYRLLPAQAPPAA